MYTLKNQHGTEKILKKKTMETAIKQDIRPTWRSFADHMTLIQEPRIDIQLADCEAQACWSVYTCIYMFIYAPCTPPLSCKADYGPFCYAIAKGEWKWTVPATNIYTRVDRHGVHSKLAIRGS